MSIDILSTWNAVTNTDLDVEYVYKISDFVRKTYNITHAGSECSVYDKRHELYVTDDSDSLFNLPYVVIINMFTSTCCKIGLQS